MRNSLFDTLPSAQQLTLLCAEPGPGRARDMQKRMDAHGMDMIPVSTCMADLTELSRHRIDMVAANYRLADGSGLNLLRTAHRHHPEAATLLLIEAQDMAQAAHALREEDIDYLVMDADGIYCDLLPLKARRLIAARRLEQERQKLARALEQEQALAAAAAESCRQGIAIFDAEQKLQICNAGFLAFFDYPATMSSRGVALSHMLDFNFRRGDYGKRVDMGEVDRRLRRLRHTGDFRFRSPSRSGVMHEIAGRRLPDGGLVMTYAEMETPRQAENSIDEPGYRDGSAGLVNAGLFHELLKHQVQRASRCGYNSAGLLIIQLDAAQDADERLDLDERGMLLAEMGRRLRLALRESDIVARLDDHRFGVLLIDVNTCEHVELVAGKLLAVLSPSHQLRQRRITLPVNIGIAFQPAENWSEDVLMAAACKAALQARKSGKNRFLFA